MYSTQRKIKSVEDLLKLAEVVLSIKSKICVCGSCGGSGKHTVEVCTSYHKGEYEDVDRGICPTCCGSGLVEERTLVKGVKLPYGEVLEDTIPYSPRGSS